MTLLISVKHLIIKISENFKFYIIIKLYGDIILL